MKKLPKWLPIALPVTAILVGVLLLIFLWPKQAPQKDTPATETTVMTQDTSDQLPPEFSVDSPESPDGTPDILPPVVPPEWWR